MVTQAGRRKDGRGICLSSLASECWGKAVVVQLAEHIKLVEPSMKGFTASNIWRMKQFYESYKDVEKLAPLVRELSWTNNLIIFSRCKTIEEREFYIHLCLREKYSKRELERQINTSVFERTMLADKKLSPAMRKLPQNAAGVFRDSYIFEFLDIPRRHCENDLQKAIIRHLRDFILEIGRDFSFVGEEYRLQVGNRDFFIDLLFYHRELQSLVAIELKVDEFQPEFMGQLNFYLEALDRDVRKPHENPSIGILLCKGKDDEVVEYALSRSVSPTLVADYETKLIPKNLLCQKLHEFYELAEVVANDD
ncbi:MAG: PDDEXK nuclease domain-containing protein [Candidatus Desantisbacteria bacterium]